MVVRRTHWINNTHANICDRHYPGWNCYETRTKKFSEPESSSSVEGVSSKVSIPQIATSSSKNHEHLDLSNFSILPLELRLKIWNRVAEEPRIVQVHTVAKCGLRSPGPPILSVCHESRIVGLKHYGLSFGFKDSREYNQDRVVEQDPEYWVKRGRTLDAIEPKVYFNFERDTLWFGKGWNRGVEGEYSCFNHLKRLLNMVDLRNVQRLGFDVDNGICWGGMSGGHRPYLGRWAGLKVLFLGMEEMIVDTNSGHLSSADHQKGLDDQANSEVEFKELGTEDEEEFMNRYRANSAWKQVDEQFSTGQALHHIRTGTGKLYGTHSGPHDHPVLAKDFCEMVCPVLVVKN